MKRKNPEKRALAGEIANAIQVGEYRPGEWMRQIDLEEKFNATRFDVRTALEELVVRKTIQHVPNRGYRVSELDHQTFSDIRDVRVILESAAGRMAAARADSQSIARLKELAKQFTEAIERGTRQEQSSANKEFHRVLYGLGGNPVLEETIWGLRDRSRQTAMTTWQSREALLRANDDHFAMIDAIERDDADRLAEIIDRHIRRS